MTFDSQKFFIGLMDVFSILLPGALSTYLLMGEVGSVLVGDREREKKTCQEPLCELTRAR